MVDNGRIARYIFAIALAAVLVLGFTSKIQVAFNYPLSNDQINHVLWIDDMNANHNYFLSDWYISTNNSLFTDFPVQFLMCYAFGLNSFAIRLGALVVYCLVGFLLMVVLRRTYGAEAALFGPIALFAAPVYLSRYYLMPNFHVGTIMSALLCLWILLEVRKCGGEGNKRAFAFTTALLFVVSVLSVFSDYLFIVIFIIPAVVSLVSCRFLFGKGLAPKGREVAVVVALILSLGGGVAMVSLSDTVGLNLAFASHNRMIPLTAASIKGAVNQFTGDMSRIFNMGFSGGRGAFGSAVFVINLVLFAAACIHAIVLIKRKDRGDGIFVLIFLITAGVLLSAAYIMRQVAHSYYLIYLMCIYAVLLSLMLSGGSSILGRAGRALMLVLFIVSASYNISEGFSYKKQEQPRLELVRFLRDKGMTYGYAYIGHSNIMTFLSDREVKVRPVRFDHFTVEPDIFHVKMEWYSYKKHTGPTFLLVMDGVEERGFKHMTPSLIRQMFGRPARTFRHGNVDIYEWNHNIIQVYWINSAVSKNKGRR